MDSPLFFNSEGQKWKEKSAISCIEQEALPKNLGNQMFKRGYARNSLYTRMSDYRYKIYCSIQIPAGVFGQKAGYTL